jgi:FkbM family methyltransferase
MLFKFGNLIQKYNAKIKGAIQVGAHHGQEIPIFRQNGIRNIICFEPVPSNFNILKETVKENAQVFNLALGNSNTRIKMNIETANAGQSSSILKPHLHLRLYPEIRFNQEIEVEMVRLDDFLQNDPNKFNFLCIDVQGYELEVLKGAEKTLVGIDYILCEVNRAMVYQGCPMVEEIDSYLKQFNFTRVETNWAGDIWGDAFYVKT